ncbi:MAG TPA: transcription termination/antitermination protein NusG [Candidatus Baltobacteraceae bacterium]|nr:transcription termination/antitermination protein NusG [Candidatus Baltobacteraceae bacterium]
MTTEQETPEAATPDVEEAPSPAPPAPPLPPHHQWFVIHTYSGFENKVKQSIEQRVAALGLATMVSQVMIPTETVVELKKGKRREASQKFFPGYVLVRMEMTDDLWYLIKNTPKVTGFVGPGVRPTPIPEAQVQAILHQVETGAERPKHRILFSRGESVRVIDGPFSNFTGVVDEVKPDKGRLKVMVSIFGRPTPVDLEFLQVERV